MRGQIEQWTGTRIVRDNFYSPLVERHFERDHSFWMPPPAHVGIDFREDAQRALLADATRFLHKFDYAQTGPDDRQLKAFYEGNSQFSSLDARMLFALLQLWAPQRIVEVGSGYSTLLMHDVNRRFLDGKINITAIEPYPRPFMAELARQGTTLIEQPVQEVALTPFRELGRGDVLFIDSSHVSKTGSDVNHLLFTILPILADGVRIHFHDVFLPNEYPREWINEGRSWNEQYLVRCLLQFADHKFRVVFGSAYASMHLTEAVAAACGKPGQGGGSLWIEKHG